MDNINFTVNGERYILSGPEVSPSTSLNDYLRNYLHLHGTKAMCHEGGCGACIVSVSQTHPRTKEKHTFAVNSCLVHVLSCHGWDVTTIEGIGNRKDGYHSLQNRLASFNGTQCGYCTPGMIMNMYSFSQNEIQKEKWRCIIARDREDEFYKSNASSVICSDHFFEDDMYLTKKGFRRIKKQPYQTHSLSQSITKLTMKEVENSFGSNICRCTGYRPILDSFKSFANDLDPQLRDKIQDLEDLDKIKCLKKRSSKREDDWCFIESEEKSLKSVPLTAGRWYKAYTVEDVFKILTREGTESYALVAGNTGQGPYPNPTQPKIQIDISSIEALKDYRSDANLIIGAGMSITDTMATFRGWSDKSEFSYLKHFYDHLDLVAHVPVRNLGTLGGNLALKNIHNDFPSDVFLLLKTVGAVVTITNSSLNKTELNMDEFLKTDLKNHLILDIKLPPLSESNLIKTYKIMPRAQNAHAIVNAGFLFKVDTKNKIAHVNIVFGNISPTFISAKDTAQKLVGDDLFSDKTLQKALADLKDELVAVEMPPEPSAECRKTLALGLFYKAILSLAPETTVNPRYKSGGTLLQRDLSKGTQTFDTDKSLWPLNQPVPKLEGLTQCSGEAEYSCDVLTEPRSVQVAFVLSEIYRGEVESIDASEALKLPGVVSFYSAKDIPGKNSFTSTNIPWLSYEEAILATTVSYYGQPIGLIAAATKKLALTAAGLVKVKYKKTGEKIVLNVRDALVAPDKDRRLRQDVDKKATNRGSDISHTFTGTFIMPSQYHFTMETQSCTVSNTVHGVKVRSSTQWMDLVQVAVGDALAIDHNRVEVEVPRIGGGYGGKGSRSSLAACACAIVAYKLNRTATLVMPLSDNMAAVGKRIECVFDYEVAINNEGKIQYLNLTYYSDLGSTFNDTAGDLSGVMSTLYDTSRWNFKGYSVLTDKPAMTWCRAPGATESVAFIEHIMERIAFTTNKDPVAIRLQHLSQDNMAMVDIVNGFKHECSFDERKTEITKFNQDNAWKKRALKTGLMAYPISYSWNFPVTISIYHADGTITMSHGGIEMGQGINTKVAQVCAYTLKVPLSKVNVKSSDTVTSPNSMVSNGSLTSDSVAFATVKACEELLRRLEVVKKDLNEPTWEEVVKAAYNKGINLQASYMTSPNDNLQGYTVYGVCVSEIELDVLTGNHVVRRVDLIEDTGISISPDIDVGQIEGAFVMGLGLWTSENLKYDTSGKLQTSNTWTYKPPGAKDIPADFRISFRRNSPNAAGVLRSKATGEPAMVLAITVGFAIHDAIYEARKEFGYNDTEWVHVDTPYNVENILKAIASNTDYYKIT